MKPAATKMAYDPNIHHRHLIRLREYDYSRSGAYFVTICSHQHQCFFGGISETQMHLNDLGVAVEVCWHDITNHYDYVDLDEFIVMPNHIHAIIRLCDMVGAGLKSAQEKRADLKSAPTRHGLGEIVRAFKTFSARSINKIRNAPSEAVWQRNYFDHIIRNQESLNRIRQYIVRNPLNWSIDKDMNAVADFVKSLNSAVGAGFKLA